MAVEETSSGLVEELHNSETKLEFDSILSMISEHCNSGLAEDNIHSRGTLGSFAEIEKSQKEIWELVVLQENGGRLPLSGWKDSWPALKRINSKGKIASAADLASIASAEKKAAEISGYVRSKIDELPLISVYSERLDIHRDIIKRIERAIGKDGQILDTASRALAKVRKQISSQRDRLRKGFTEYSAKKSGGKGYEFVTVRGERYLVSMPLSEASNINGIVHQTSGSGASVFIEPMEFVDGNNRLEQLLQDEKKETARILADLTADVFDAREVLLSNQELLLELDIISSKALFSVKYGCICPLHSGDGTMILHQARHPLLEKKLSSDGSGKIVGLDMNCGADMRVLVISGPNAGGKTIALKTVGLILMMDRSGLPVPCEEGTVLPDHRNIFVDIGDDQSIERSLSTFSSKIGRMKRILEYADCESLVLIDEIGDGTDPGEGASIACALLEELSSLCGRTIVTTHMSALKGWAHEKGSAENATLEFDSGNLQPLFRMRMGVPGRSWGIEMAGRMGLPGRIIDDARNRLEESSLRLEELLGHLEKTERLLILEREGLLRKEEEISRLISSYRDHIDSFEKERDDMVREARKDALDIVSSTRAEMERLVREIRITHAERSVILRSKDILEKKSRDFERKVKTDKGTAAFRPEELKIGMFVKLGSINREGKIIECRDISRVKVELEGGLRVETKIDDLSEAEHTRSDRPAGSVSWTPDPEEPVSTELMIRGLERIEALEEVDAFLDKAVIHGLDTVSIIHGIGKGVLKKAVYEMLRSDPRIESVEPGEPALGGDGVAVVRLK